MRERQPFSLYKLGRTYYPRFWDEQLSRYNVTTSTK
jgi:hypothetical protein